jgi:hypothetical protein
MWPIQKGDMRAGAQLKPLQGVSPFLETFPVVFGTAVLLVSHKNKKQTKTNKRLKRRVNSNIP